MSGHTHDSAHIPKGAEIPTDKNNAALAKVDAEYDGKKFITLLFVSLVIALIVIYVLASIGTGDFSWKPFGNEAKHI